MRSMKRWLALLVVFGLIAAACSQGTTEETEAPEATEAPEVTEASETTEDTEAPEATEAPEDVKFDGVTVTDDTIYIGMLADLSGPFSGLNKDAVDAELYAYEEYNANGGVAGRWKIEVLVGDTGYDVTVHGEKYAELKDKVVAFSQSTGSPHTAAIADQLVEDNRFVIPLSWYSGWSDPDIGENVLEQGASFCVDAMNLVEHTAEKFEAENGRLPTIGVVTLPGDFGQDGAIGAKIAIEELGLELVYDGEAKVAREGNTEAIQGLVDAKPDVVLIASTPGAMGEIFGGTTQLGLTDAQWVGLFGAFNIALLDTPLRDELIRRYTHVSTWAPYGADVEGMDELVALMNKYDPDRALTDMFSRGWIDFKIMTAVLEAAAAAGDLTPAGVTAAAKSLESVSFGEISPAQTWAGDPNDFIVRGTNIFGLRDDYEPSTVAEGTGVAYDVIETGWVGDIAANWTYEPCYKAEG